VKVAALLLAAVVAAPAPASLTAVGFDPFTVKGARFKSRERVKLVVSSPGVDASRVVRADARGRFRASFRLTIGRCDPVTVKALGRRGSRASLRLDVVHCTAP
jgi:hypothetical protein